MSASAGSMPQGFGAPRGAAVAMPQPGRINLPGRASEAETQAITAPARGQWEQTWLAFREHRMAFFGLCTLAAMMVICILLPFVLPSPTDIDMKILSASAPSAQHPLGTDQIGRDMLSRLVNAGRKSLLIGFVVAIFTATVGSIVGVAAGYFGGKVDDGLMWFVNVLMTIPTLPLMIATAVLIATPDSEVGAIFAKVPEEWRIIIVLSALGWMGLSRMVRSQVLSLRQQEFCEAALALGANHSRVMFIHILPNTVSVIAVATTFAVSGAIMGESALSFLGVGVQPPTATWGNMLSEARDLFTILQYWWLTWFPALMIFITVLAVNFVGDGVRDAMDPKSQKK